MKKLMFLLCLVALPVQATDPWSDADIARQAAYLTLHVADWGQTRNIVHRRDEGHSETNQILGKYPSIKRVDSYFVFTGLLHTGISHVLPSEYRKYWQYVTIIDRAGYVRRNVGLGIKVDF